MTGTLVVDTSVLVDHLRQFEPATQLLEDALRAQRPLVSSELCRLEIIAGMRAREKRATTQLLSLLEWWPVDQRVLETAQTLARRHGPANRGIGAVDYVLAATTKLLGGQLVTVNVKHFPMIPGLRVPY